MRYLLLSVVVAVFCCFSGCGFGGGGEDWRQEGGSEDREPDDVDASLAATVSCDRMNETLACVGPGGCSGSQYCDERGVENGPTTVAITASDESNRSTSAVIDVQVTNHDPLLGRWKAINGISDTLIFLESGAFSSYIFSPGTWRRIDDMQIAVTGSAGVRLYKASLSNDGTRLKLSETSSSVITYDLVESLAPKH